MNSARSGQQYSSTYSRPQKLWLAEEHGIGDLMGPISKLFSLLGYGDAHEEWSCAAVLVQGIEGYRHDGNYPMTSLVVQQRSREMMLDAFKDAQGVWSSFFRHKSVAAPFPITWLSEESTCDMALEATKKSARTFTEWSADLGSLVQASPVLQQPAQKPPPSSGGTAAELAKIISDNKRLREEVTKQQLANKKTVQRSALPSVITLPARFSSVRNQCRRACVVTATSVSSSAMQ